jgi:V8-like Glu-specific endopeptidase
MEIKYLALVLLTGFASVEAAAQSPPPRKDISAIAKAANGAIVSIVMSDKGGKPITQGSGFLVSKDGVVVTNYHVISEGTSAVIKLPDGAFYVVDGVLASDKARDVAVIKAHGQYFWTLTLGNSDRVQVGEQVVAIGNPLSLESTVSNGIVSAIRTIEEDGGRFLQVTISPGSSGGPLFNMAGEVVGITTLKFKGGENLNFAIPINDAKQLLRITSSKIQPLPNETESVKTQSQGHGEATAGARQYYQQLLEAGAFSAAGKESFKGMIPTQDYACFSDDPHSDTFFTFIAKGYDQEYAEVHTKWYKLRVHSSSEFQESEKYYQQMRTIEQTADYPYLRFIQVDEFNTYPSDLQEEYRHGARSLRAHVYENGVKTATILYIGLDREWQDPDAGPLTSSHLAIEPSTMRYVMRNWRTDNRTDTVQAGVCEKVDPDPYSK